VAEEWYAKAAAQGHELARYNLKLLQLPGMKEEKIKKMALAQANAAAALASSTSVASASVASASTAAAAAASVSPAAAAGAPAVSAAARAWSAHPFREKFDGLFDSVPKEKSASAESLLPKVRRVKKSKQLRKAEAKKRAEMGLPEPPKEVPKPDSELTEKELRAKKYRNCRHRRRRDCDQYKEPENQEQTDGALERAQAKALLAPLVTKATIVGESAAGAAGAAEAAGEGGGGESEKEAQFWAHLLDLADYDKSGKLGREEFGVAYFLAHRAEEGYSLPSGALPKRLIPPGQRVAPLAGFTATATTTAAPMTASGSAAGTGGSSAAGDSSSGGSGGGGDSSSSSSSSSGGGRGGGGGLSGLPFFSKASSLFSWNSKRREAPLRVSHPPSVSSSSSISSSSSSSSSTSSSASSIFSWNSNRKEAPDFATKTFSTKSLSDKFASHVDSIEEAPLPSPQPPLRFAVPKSAPIVVDGVGGGNCSAYDAATVHGEALPTLTITSGAAPEDARSSSSASSSSTAHTISRECVMLFSRNAAACPPRLPPRRRRPLWECRPDYFILGTRRGGATSLVRKTEKKERRKEGKKETD